MDMCTGATIYDEDGAELTQVDESCRTVWMGGPEISEWGTYLSDSGDDSLMVHVTAEDWNGNYDDVTVMYEIHEITDDGNVVHLCEDN